jgi:mono/diheme cytochrome c family protein
MTRSDVRRSGRVNRVALVVVAVALLSLGVLAYVYRDKLIGPDPVRAGNQDHAASRAAFLEAYKVFMHPRCMNCHPSGDVPLQGDDSRLHAQNVKRGADGKGKYALKCGNCHQDTNLPGANMPPGNPNWHLPKKEMPLVFQGKTSRELADQLKDPRRNGGKTLEQLVEHVTNDKLVQWGWEPGDGRTKPPLSHEDFVKKFREWVEKGAASPK